MVLRWLCCCESCRALVLWAYISWSFLRCVCLRCCRCRFLQPEMVTVIASSTYSILTTFHRPAGANFFPRNILRSPSMHLLTTPSAKVRLFNSCANSAVCMRTRSRSRWDLLAIRTLASRASSTHCVPSLCATSPRSLGMLCLWLTFLCHTYTFLFFLVRQKCGSTSRSCVVSTSLTVLELSSHHPKTPRR